MAAPAIDSKTGGLKSKEFIVKQHLSAGQQGIYPISPFQADQNFNTVADFKVIVQSKTTINHLPIDVTIKTASIIVAQNMPIQQCSAQTNQNQDYRILVDSPTRTPIALETNISSPLSDSVDLYYIFKLV